MPYTQPRYKKSGNFGDDVSWDTLQDYASYTNIAPVVKPKLPWYNTPPNTGGL